MGLQICPMQAFIRTAAHWEAIVGRGEVTDCNQNSFGLLHNVCVFCFCFAAQTDQSQSIIYLATGSAHFFWAANKSLLWAYLQPHWKNSWSRPKVSFVENLLCHSSVLHLQSNLKGRSILAKLPLLRFCCWSAVVVRGVERNCKTNLPHGLLLSCTQCINSQS